MESIRPKTPEIVLENKIELTEKYELDTANKIFEYLTDRLTGFKSIKDTPSPELYLQKPQFYADDWANFLLAMKDQPDQLKAQIKGCHLSFYLMYIRNYCIQEGLATDLLNP